MKVERKHFTRPLPHAFTRLDALASICAVALLFITFGSAFGRMATRQDEAVCNNNLRIITQGYTAFANEHGERYPWQLGYPEWTGSPWIHNLWFKFFALSNYVQSPRVLADPADYRQPDQPQLHIATSWGNAEGGLVNPYRRNSAFSYFLSQYGTPLHPQSFLSGDRNLVVEDASTSQFPGRQIIRSRTTAWTDQVHRRVGHIAFTDGAVEMTDTTRLLDIIAWWPSDYGAVVQLPFWSWRDNLDL